MLAPGTSVITNLLQTSFFSARKPRSPARSLLEPLPTDRSPVGPQGRIFLCRSYGYTFDDRFMTYKMRAPYPLPEEYFNSELGQRMFWNPVAWDEDTGDEFWKLVEEGGFPDAPIPKELIGATVVEMIREY